MAKDNTNYDITGKVGDLYPTTNPEWPMFSFDRPSYILWNAIGKVLDEAGWTEDQVKDWLQSKSPRWALDGTLGDAIKTLGKAFAETAIIKEPKETNQ
jgi:hypothetical protein